MFKRNIWIPLLITVLVAIPLLLALARHPSLANIIAITALVVLLPIFLFNFETGFWLLIAIRPTLDAFSDVGIVSFGPYLLNLSSVVGVVATVWAITYLISRRTYFWRQPLFWPFLVFTLLSVTSLAYTISAADTFREVVRIVSIFLIFLLAGAMVTTRTKFYLFLRAVMWSAIIPLAVGFYQLLTRTGLNYGELDNRIYGTLVHPNAFALYLALILGVGLTYWISHKQRLNKWLLVGLIAAAIELLLTFTRGGWIGLAIILIILGIRYYRKLVIKLGIIALLIVVLSPIITRLVFNYFDYDLSRNQIVRRLTVDSDSESSMDWRLKLWTEMSRKISDKPIQGYGLGAFPILREQYVKGFFESTEAHNDYLRLVIELGILGLGSYLILLGSSIYIFCRRFLITLRQHKEDAWLLGGLAIMLAFIVMSFFENVIQGTAAMWLLWSLVAAILNRSSWVVTRGRN